MNFIYHGEWNVKRERERERDVAYTGGTFIHNKTLR
jgi:hypothetical protein